MTFLRSLAFLVLPLLCVDLSRAQTPTDITSQLTFTTIDVPGAGYTGALGINKAGDVVGDYGQDTNTDANGFLYSGGTFTYFDYPGQSVTIPERIRELTIPA